MEMLITAYLIITFQITISVLFPNILSQTILSVHKICTFLCLHTGGAAFGTGFENGITDEMALTLP